jgi:hypothetical protein
MASSLANPSPTPNNSSLVQPTGKLTKANHVVWLAQVHAALQGAKLMGYLTGTSTVLLVDIPRAGADGKEVKDSTGKVLIA